MTKRTAIFLSLLILIPLTITTADDGDSRPASSALKYTRWIPAAIYDDGVSSARLEVAVEGNVSSVTFAFDDRNFNDRGLNGDRVAGDNIWTMEGITVQNYNMTFPDHDTLQMYLHIKMKDGSLEQTWTSSLGIVSKKKYVPKKVAADVWASKFAVFLIDSKKTMFNGKWPVGSFEYKPILNTFFQTYPDKFDFIVLMPASSIFEPNGLYERVPSFFHVTMPIRNTGHDPLDNSDYWGSSGTLTGVIYHSFGAGAVLDHEIAHNWGVFFPDSLNLSGGGYGAHYKPHMNVGGQLSSYPYYKTTRKSNGNYIVKRYMDGGDEGEQGAEYPPLTLYLMGLVPASDVPDVLILNNPAAVQDWDNVPENAFDRITMNEIVNALGGVRKPAFPNTKKRFKMAMVVVTDHIPTDAEGDFFSQVVRYFCSKEKGAGYLKPFYAATGGRARIKGRIPNIK